ncbi:Nephrinlike, partial [Caligus rogercresseyi]
PLMKSSDSIFASSSSNHPGGSYYANAKYPPGYHHSFDYVVPPAQQSTPRSNGSSSVGSNNLNSNLDNYCVYVNSTALLQPGLSAQNVGKVSSLATHV